MKRFAALLIALLMLCLMVPTTALADDAKPFWVTHFNDSTAEGAGSIFTEPYIHAGWWVHFAFAPTDVDGVYKIVDTANGLTDGTAIPLEIPEGGFVWAANYGNDYISLGMGDTDFTSPNCKGCIDDVVANWMTGTLVKFEGLDLDTLTVPTSTPDTNWYDDAYVCTATYSIYSGDAEVVVPGDESSESTESSEATESTESTEESTESDASSESTESDASSAASSESSEAEEGGLSTGALIAIIAAAVVVIGVVVLLVVKKK